MLVIIESMGAVLVYKYCIWNENCDNTQTRMHYHKQYPTPLPDYGGGVAAAENAHDEIWMFLIDALIPIIVLSRWHGGEWEYERQVGWSLPPEVASAKENPPWCDPSI